MQIQQPGIPLIALNHYFPLKVRKSFIVCCFFPKKTSEWFLEQVKRSFGNPSGFFGQKPHFLNSKSENNFKKCDSLPES